MRRLLTATKPMKKVRGAYSVITMINQVGLFAFDQNGIGPLVIGQRKAVDGWIVTSFAWLRRIRFGPLGFEGPRR